MEIKDTQAIYNFLGSLSWPGNIAFFTLAAIVVAFITINISEKIFDSATKKQKKYTTLTVVLLVLICGLVLKIEANTSREQLREANAIKSYFLEVSKKYRSFDKLADDIVLNSGDSLCKRDSNCIRMKIDRIKEVVNNYPDEFVAVPVNDVNIYTNKAESGVAGLEIIDKEATKYVDSSVRAMIPFYQSKIIHHMLQQRVDTLSYEYIFNKLDGRCDEGVIDKVVLNSNGLLIPINGYDDKPCIILDATHQNKRSVIRKFEN